MATFGLIGKNITHSFSKVYFEDFFKKNNLPHHFVNFDINDLTELPESLHNYPDIKGLSITHPYKIEIIKRLDFLDEEARNIGAVNSIRISSEKKWHGYNTDGYGFRKSLLKHLQSQKKALILGTGGASMAVKHVLQSVGIAFLFVSRRETLQSITYQQLTPSLIEEYTLIINCTPLGSGFLKNSCPDIPYYALSRKHLLFDLTYNPAESLFLKNGKKQDADIVNGMEMLIYQAEKSWEYWNYSL